MGLQQISKIAKVAITNAKQLQTSTKVGIAAGILIEAGCIFGAGYLVGKSSVGDKFEKTKTKEPKVSYDDAVAHFKEDYVQDKTTEIKVKCYRNGQVKSEKVFRVVDYGWIGGEHKVSRHTSKVVKYNKNGDTVYYKDDYNKYINKNNFGSPVEWRR